MAQIIRPQDCFACKLAWKQEIASPSGFDTCTGCRCQCTALRKAPPTQPTGSQHLHLRVICLANHAGVTESTGFQNCFVLANSL